MFRIIVALSILLLSGMAHPQSNESLQLIETNSLWIGEGAPPSCGLVKARSEQRQKLIREYQFYMENLPQAYDDFFVDSYLMNRLFLDPKIWQDETILVKHRWQVPPEVKEALFLNRDSTYFRLESDGVAWISRFSMFPEEVQFVFHQEASEIETFHETYYIDLCEPKVSPRLVWYADSSQSLLTTPERIQKFLANTKGESHE